MSLPKTSTPWGARDSDVLPGAWWGAVFPFPSFESPSEGAWPQITLAGWSSRWANTLVVAAIFNVLVTAEGLKDTCPLAVLPVRSFSSFEFSASAIKLTDWDCNLIWLVPSECSDFDNPSKVQSLISCLEFGSLPETSSLLTVFEFRHVWVLWSPCQTSWDNCASCMPLHTRLMAETEADWGCTELSRQMNSCPSFSEPDGSFLTTLRPDKDGAFLWVWNFWLIFFCFFATSRRLFCLAAKLASCSLRTPHLNDSMDAL